MIEITRENIRDFTYRKLLVVRKEHLTDSDFHGYSGVQRGDVMISSRNGLVDGNSKGILKIQKKSLKEVECMRIIEFSETGDYVHVQTVSGWKQEGEDWYDVDNFLDSLDFLDIDHREEKAEA